MKCSSRKVGHWYKIRNEWNEWNEGVIKYPTCIKICVSGQFMHVKLPLIFPSMPEESTIKKLKRKLQENPFVIPAFAATVYGVVKMGTALNRGDKHGFQLAQRFKVVSQLILIGVLVGGAYYQESQKIKELPLS